MKVIRKRLDEVQTRPPFTRWNEALEQVEITWDEGETWVESPENDPRYGCGYRAPARTGMDAKCDAAANMVDVIRRQVDAAIAAAEAVGLATALLAIVTAFIPGINILVSIFVAVASALIAFGAAALAADFTEENYDTLVCIFYDNIDSNGQVSTAQLEDILTDIATQWGASVIHPVCELLFDLMGENGFSNAGALGAETGDCVDCIDLCPYWIFPSPEQGQLDGYQTAGGYWVDSSGAYVALNYGTNLYWTGDMSKAFIVPVGCTITGGKYSITQAVPGGGYNHMEFWVGLNRTDGLSTPGTYLYGTPRAAGEHTFSRTIVGSGQTVILSLAYTWAKAQSPRPSITLFELLYTGNKPEFVGGTECPE